MKKILITIIVIFYPLIVGAVTAHYIENHVNTTDRYLNIENEMERICGNHGWSLLSPSETPTSGTWECLDPK